MFNSNTKGTEKMNTDEIIQMFDKYVI
ncbi:hypothetical protein LCGC14_3063560, partial [marine sediment metagenome]